MVKYRIPGEHNDSVGPFASPLLGQELLKSAMQALNSVLMLRLHEDRSQDESLFGVPKPVRLALDECIDRDAVGSDKNGVVWVVHSPFEQPLRRSAEFSHRTGPRQERDDVEIGILEYLQLVRGLQEAPPVRRRPLTGRQASAEAVHRPRHDLSRKPQRCGRCTGAGAFKADLSEVEFW